MAARPEGVYADGKGGWYFKATVGTDPLPGKRVQATNRGFRSPTVAGKARAQLAGNPPPSTARHRSPGPARVVLPLMGGDRTFAGWAFLLGSGMSGMRDLLTWIREPRRTVAGTSWTTQRSR